ncbi:MAG: magnesium transporter MgtE [Paracoccaceae bacterium]|nr:MAG: magnesium transporter MgtE [Paracoccaceae bacterium]
MAEDAEREGEGRRDEAVVNAELIASVREALEAGDRAALLAQLAPLHAADIADLLEHLDDEDRIALIRLWGDDLDPDVLTELSEGVRNEIVPELTESQLARLARELETDDVVYLVEDLDEPEQEKVLEALDDADRVAVEKSLTYPEYSAGRLMQRELVTAPEHWTVGDVIDYMRASDELPETFYDVIIVDPRMRPVGMVPLSRIMAHRRDTPLAQLMTRDFHSFRPDQPQEDVAYAFNHYHLITAPVVDENGRLVGVITIDDAMAVLDEEAEEDILRLAGVGDEEISDSVWETVRLRFVWLSVNLATAILASMVISIFEDSLQAVVALAVLMPIVASMGGNAGTQTLTVAVRALATRDLTAANMWRVVGREILVGLFNGLAFALIMGLIGGVWFSSLELALVLGAAMVINLVAAALAGILIPIALQKAGADPAIASGTFVTTVTDVVGFFAFLGLATLVLL